MAPFDRSSTSSYSRFLVAMALSCIVSEIKQDISRKSQYFHTSHVFDATVKRGGGASDDGRNFWRQERQMRMLQLTTWCKNIDEQFNPMNRLHQRHRLSDRRQTELWWHTTLRSPKKPGLVNAQHIMWALLLCHIISVWHATREYRVHYWHSALRHLAALMTRVAGACVRAVTSAVVASVTAT